MSECEIFNYKKEYNEYLLRHIKASVYLDNNNIPVTTREKWIPEYRKILDNLNRILNIFKANNVRFTTDQALGGFDLEINTYIQGVF